MVIGLYDIFNARWGEQTIWLYSDPHFGGAPKKLYMLVVAL